MKNEKVMYFALGVVSVWAYHKFVKAIPGKTSSAAYMPIIGMGVVFIGYSLAYYGYSQLNGGNWGYLDLLLPSRATAQKLVNIPRDGAKK